MFDRKEWRRKNYLKNIEKRRELSRQYYQKNKHKLKKRYNGYVRKYYLNHRKKYGNSQDNKYARISYLRLKYNITLSDYDALFNKQNSLCAICNKTQPSRRLSVDHCHKTGKIRGLLCIKCNRGIGCFDDNTEFLESAIVYLKK